MAYVRKHFRWGSSFLAILHHFSAPEIKALLKNCRKLIRDYRNAALEGEGYGASIIPFEMFEYGFVLAYDHDDEEWALEVVTFPDWGSPHCKRRRPREEGAAERRRRNRKELRRSSVSWFVEDVIALLVETRALGPIFTKFWADNSTGGRLHAVAEMLRKIRIPHPAKQNPSVPLPMFKDFAEQRTHDYSDLVQLVLAKVNAAVGFPRPLWTFSSRRALREPCSELWDASLFGSSSEQGSG